MRSILNQLTKYHPPEADKARQVPAIELKAQKHPYQDMVESLCDCTDPIRRKRTINDALLFLNDFNPPAMTGELFPWNSPSYTTCSIGTGCSCAGRGRPTAFWPSS